MPVFTFVYPSDQTKAGCVERIVVNGALRR